MDKSKSKLGAFTVVVALVASLVTVLGATRADALSPGVDFGAGDLSTWQTNGVVWAVGESQGRVIAGGDFTQLRPPNGGVGTPVSTTGLAILDAQSGAPDACQMNVALIGGTPTVRALTTSDDGKTVFVGGNFSSINGVGAARIAAIDVATCSVKALRIDAIPTYVHGLAVRGNTLYFAGEFTTVAGAQRQRFAAVNATTGALLPWRVDADATGRALAISPDGTKIAVGGDFFNVNGSYSHSIAVVDATSGALLKTYPAGFIPNTSVTKHIFSGTDGRFYVSNEGSGGGVFDGRLAVSWNTLNQVWRDNCLGATQATYEYQGTLYVASHAHECSENGFQDGKRNFFMAQDAATSELLGWDPTSNDGIGEGIGPRALTVATGRTNGKAYLWSGGEFTLVNGKPQQGLTRFGPDNNSTPSTVVPVIQPMSEGAMQVSWQAALDPDDSELSYSVYRNGSSTPIWTGQASSVWWKRPQVTFVDTTVKPGLGYTYTVQVSDGTNRSAMSGATGGAAIATGPSAAAAVRADRPSLYWNGPTTGSWVRDAGASTSDTRRLSGQTMKGTGGSTDSAASDGSGSLSFDGTDDYVWNDEFAPAPSTYSVQAWVKTTTTRGGKLIGYGNGRPMTGSGNSVLSGSYDRHLYMENTGFVRFGVYTGQTVTLRSPAALNDGKWHQVVGTQGAAGMALYVDGKRVGTNTVANAQSYKGVWRVGGDNVSSWPNAPTSSFLAGLVDDVSVFPAALSRQAVAGQYAAAGGALTIQPRPTDAYGAKVYDDDPDLYWRLAESSGTTATDSSYQGASPGTYGSSVTKGTAGAVPDNAAATTPGTSNSSTGTIGSQTSSTPPSTFSAEAWFNTSSTTGGKIFGFESAATGTGGSSDKNLYLSSDGRLNFGTSTGTPSVVRTAASYNDGKWHHVVATVGSGGTRLYVDGVSRASSSTATSSAAAGFWRLGGGHLAGWPNASSNTYFNGKVDEFAVYSSALGAPAVATHQSLGTADVTAPSTPTDVTANATGGQVTVSWTPSTDNNQVSGYRVHRGVSADFTPSAATLVGSPTGATFSEPAGTGTYYYRVVAIDAAGNASGASTAAQVDVPDTAAPTTPANVTATVQGGGQVTVAWEQSTDNVAVTSYDVHRGSTAGFTPDAASKIGGAGTNSYADIGLGRGTYYYKVVARDAAGNASSASSAASVTVSDTQAPTTPSGLTATTSGNDVTVAWGASTDDVGVTSYGVFRGTTSGFAAGTASKIADVTTRSYVDQALAAGTYYYKVVAQDAAGNLSPATAAASATVAASPQTTTVTVLASQDALAVSGAPTANYGTYDQLSSRGGAGALESFLRFDLPAAPAGTALTGASLAVRTSGDPTAASTNDTALDVVDPGWSEGTLNWNNRPTGAGTAFGTLRGTSATYTDYRATGSATALRGSLGSTVALRMSMAGTDNLRVFSRDIGFAPYVPALSLTFSPTSAGDTTAPSTPSGVSTQVSGNDVAVTWNASSDNTAVTGYTVHRGTTSGFTPAAGNKIADVTTTSYTNSNVAAGTYYYKVVATDAAGNTSSPSSSATATVAPAADTTAPSTPSGVSTQVSGNDVAVTWNASSDNTAVTGYTVHRGTTSGFTPAAGNKIADVTTTSYTNSNVAAGTYHYKVVATDAAGNTSSPSSSATATVAPAADTTAPSTPSGVSTQVSGNDVAVTWNASSDNTAVTGYTVHRGTTSGFTPAAGTKIADVTTTSYTNSNVAAGTYHYKVVATDAAGNTSSPSSSATATVAPAADTTAPSTPSGVSTQVSGNDVAVTWNASSDNTAVTGYTVHRGTTSGFTPAAGNKIADVTTTRHDDTSLAPGTYHYKVVATDAAGNTSAASAAGDATIGAPSGSTTVTLTPTEDAFAASSTPAANYGTYGQLAARAGASPQEGFLRYVLPAAPAGTALTSATISVQTSGDPAAGSADATSVQVFDGTWSESSLTWANRPTAAGVLFATLNATTDTDTRYQADATPAAIRPLLGGPVSLRLAGTGADNLRIISRESGFAPHRPTLTLTFSPQP